MLFKSQHFKQYLGEFHSQFQNIFNQFYEL